jgi:hypothetical protein
LFGNLSGQIRELLPGAILQPDRRHWHNASQAACLLYRDILRIVHQLIVDYLHTPHRELDGMTPHEKWLHGLELMTPLAPPLTPQLERSFWRLNPESRIATREGLALFGLHYWDVGLAGLRSRDRQGRQRRYYLRYDPIDVSRIAVFENGIWLGDGSARELRLADGSYESVSLWELELAKDLIRQRDHQHKLRPHSWLVHILEARELIEQRQAEQKLIRRKLQQLDFSIFPGTYRIENALSELKVVVQQNGRFDNQVTGLSPTYTAGNKLSYINNKALIFEGGNEYHSFDISSIYAYGQGVNKIRFFDPYYHAELLPDKIDPYSQVLGNLRS